VALKHKTEPPPALRALRADVPAWFERIVQRCLEKDPARRFPDAAELAAELRRPRRGRPARWRALASGDRVLEDEGESSDWALVLAAPREKGALLPRQALKATDLALRPPG
jgi:serine/threonine protein kinase